jgi:hypothetical protein
MSRWYERDEKNDESAGLPDGLSRPGGEARQRSPDEHEFQKSFGENRREPVRVHDRVFHLRPSERASLDALGRFRVIDAGDLGRGIYGKDGALAQSDFRALIRQRLMTPVSIRSAEGETRRLFTLTRDGHAVARSRAGEGQQLYWGFAKPAECVHDSRLYRAYLHEERQLIAKGDSVKRVVLDYALKRDYFSRLNTQRGGKDYRQRQWEVGRELHLSIIDGHVVFPDFRIEYEDERGELGRVDVEVATGNYRGQHVASKSAAGFRVYADGRTAGRLGVAKGPLLGGRFVPTERSAVLLL